jgi:hypothetical protein
MSRRQRGRQSHRAEQTQHQEEWRTHPHHRRRHHHSYSANMIQDTHEGRIGREKQG